MTVKTSKVAGRTSLHFNSLDEVVAAAEQMVTKPHRTLGNWDASQILEHLTASMNLAFDGASFKAPWFFRTLIAPFVKKSLLTKPMSAGFQLPKVAATLIPSSTIDLTTSLNDLRKAVNRFKTEIPDNPHPFLGKLTPEEYLQLHLRHSEMHLSFIVPE